MKKIISLALAAVICSASMLLAACGGSTTSDTESTAAETKTVASDIKALDTQLKKVTDDLAKVQYKVSGTTLEFFGISEKTA